MKEKLLLLCLFLTMSTGAFAAQPQNAPQEMEVKQKACQNVFSLVNIDLSFMSPRGTAADVSMSAPPPCPCAGAKGPIVPIVDKKPPVCEKCPPPKPEVGPQPPMPNRTSLFRIDLLHIFKIQIL